MEKKDRETWFGGVSSAACVPPRINGREEDNVNLDEVLSYILLNSCLALNTICLLTATIAGYFVMKVTRDHVMPMIFCERKRK